MRIAMISEHASPLAHLGGVDAGGQNVHVAELSAALVRRGHEVVVYTRRDDPGLPDRVGTEHGYTVAHLPAGPPRMLTNDALLQHMYAFGHYLETDWAAAPPDVAHAHFWMSGLAAQRACAAVTSRSASTPAPPPPCRRSICCSSTGCAWRSTTSCCGRSHHETACDRSRFDPRRRRPKPARPGRGSRGRNPPCRKRCAAGLLIRLSSGVPASGDHCRSVVCGLWPYVCR